jgi:hypothetical protein
MEPECSQEPATGSFLRLNVFESDLYTLDFKLPPWNEYWFLVLGFFHGVRGEFLDAAVANLIWLLLKSDWPLLHTADSAHILSAPI